MMDLNGRFQKISVEGSVTGVGLRKILGWRTDRGLGFRGYPREVGLGIRGILREVRTLRISLNVRGSRACNYIRG